MGGNTYVVVDFTYESAGENAKSVTVDSLVRVVVKFQF